MGGLSFSPKQKTAMLWWARPEYAACEAVICDGAVRSGKTLAFGLGFFFWTMQSFDGKSFGLCGKTAAALRRNLLAEVLPRLRELGYRCEEKRSENSLTVRYGGRENRFLLFGGTNEGSAAHIQGVTLAGALFDEVALMPRSFVEQACARCSVTGSRLWFSCNPEGPQHWFYREWILRAKERNALRLHFTMEDNPGLSRCIRRRYEMAYSGTFYRRFILGEWVEAEGRVYDFFAPQHDARPLPRGEAERRRVSVDYGTVNPTSFGLWEKHGETWYRTAEYYFDSRTEKRQKTDAEYAADLKAFIGTRTVERVIVDPSAASFIEALRREGIRAVKADNDVRSGLRVTADLLKQGRIAICRNCENALREIADYCWAGDGRDAPRKENDHAMDDLRYFAMSVANERESVGIAACAAERWT